MKTPLLLFVIAGALFVPQFTGLASAAVGFSSDPAGYAWDRNQTGTAFAEWDLFSGPGSPAYTISGDAPDSFFGLPTATLGQSGTLTGVVDTDQGAGAYESFGSGFNGTAGNKLLYSGNRALVFTLTGDAGFAIKGFALQVKRVLSTAGTEAPFFVTLNGSIAPDRAVTTSGNGDTATSTAGLWSTTTYYWGASLASSDATTFTVEFGTQGLTTPTKRIAVDTISVDVGNVAVIPEPSTGAVLVAGVALLGLFQRRRSKQLSLR